MEQENKGSVKPAQQPEQSERESVVMPSPEEQAPTDTGNPPASPESDASPDTRNADSLQDTVKSILKTFLTEEKRKQHREQEHAIYNFNFVQGHNYGSMVGGDNVGDIVNGVKAPGSPEVSQEEKTVENTVENILRNQDFVTRSALIMLAMLEYVPADIFNEMTCDLCRCLTGNEEQNVSFLWRAKDLLSGVPLTEGNRNPYLYAETAIVWVGFQDATLADWVRALIWKGQRQLRKAVLKWLFGLRERTDSFPERLTADMSMLSLTRLCSLDLAYAKETVFPMLEQAFTRQRDIKYLVAFFQSFMRMDEACQKAANQILRRWSGYDLLWQVPYRLYGQTHISGEWSFQETMPDALYEKMETDIDGGKRGDIAAWFQQNRGHYLLPIHRKREEALTLQETDLEEAMELNGHSEEARERNEHSRTLSALLVQQTGKLFASGRSRSDRECAALFFLSLLRWDYLTDYSSKPQLVFLRCLQRKTLREQLLPMFQAVCRPPFLYATAQILSSHMTEIQEHEDAYRNLEKSMLILGKADYSGVMALLRACEQNTDAAPVAARLRTALRQSKEKR